MRVCAHTQYMHPLVEVYHCVFVALQGWYAMLCGGEVRRYFGLCCLFCATCFDSGSLTPV